MVGNSWANNGKSTFINGNRRDVSGELSGINRFSSRKRSERERERERERDSL